MQIGLSAYCCAFASSQDPRFYLYYLWITEAYSHEVHKNIEIHYQLNLNLYIVNMKTVPSNLSSMS